MKISVLKTIIKVVEKVTGVKWMSARRLCVKWILKEV